MTAVASPIDAKFNPSAPEQRLILWNNGRIDALGGALPAVDNTTWYDRFEPPAMALHVTDWVTSSGYVLDYRGGIHPFGAAPEIGTGEGGAIVAGIPLSASPRERLYVDFSMDPAGTGQGYVLDLWGKLLPFGGATAPPRTGRRFPSPRARRLEMRWTPDKRALTIDMHGRMYADFTGSAPARPSTLGALGPDIVRDFAVTDWATASGHILDPYGGTHEFGSAPDARGFPYRRGGDVARVLNVLSAADPQQFWQVWSGGQSYEYVSSTPPTVTAGGGQSEVQTVTITGTPTGGTFTLTYSGQTTTGIARNATAATVDAALEALSNIGAGDVTVTGGPGPGTPWVVTFGGALALTDVAQMTATSSLTGGTSPTVSVATTTPGEATTPAAIVTDTTRPVLAWDYSDPQSDSQAAYQLLVFTQAWVTGHTMTDPLLWAGDALVSVEGIDPGARGITSPVDLANGDYRMYVRAQDTAGQWSAWSNHGWTQNITPPPTPTGLAAAEDQAAGVVDLQVSTTAGTADLVRFEVSDDGGTSWAVVRGADAVPRIALTLATDLDPPLGVTRTYRAIAYAIDPRVASAASNTDTATITTLTYMLTAVDDPTLGGRIWAQEPVEWTRSLSGGVFQGIDADYPTVVKDGNTPKGRRSTVHIHTDDATARAMVDALVLSRSTLVYRDPFGAVRYCEVIGENPEALWPRAATRNMHTTDIPLVEVRPPHLDL